jgi:hypothetical protein
VKLSSTSRAAGPSRPALLFTVRNSQADPMVSHAPCQAKGHRMADGSITRSKAANGNSEGNLRPYLLGDCGPPEAGYAWRADQKRPIPLSRCEALPSGRTFPTATRPELVDSYSPRNLQTERRQLPHLSLKPGAKFEVLSKQSKIGSIHERSRELGLIH